MIEKTQNSIRIKKNTIYTKQGNKSAKEQLWWDLPVNQEYNPQNNFTKFSFKNSNFDTIIFKWKNNKNYNSNKFSNVNPNVLELTGGNQKADVKYTNKIRQGIFLLDKDSNGNTTYEFIGIYTPIQYVKSSNIELTVKIEDDLYCEF